MAEGVRYIKISKIDKNGVDNTITLQSLTKLTIPYSSGDVTYDILTISEQPTHFVYYVENPNIEWADRADIKYDFTGSIDSMIASFSGGVENPRTAHITTITDNLSYLEDFTSGGYLSSRYTLKTYAQKSIYAQASGSITLASSTSNDYKLYLTLDGTEIGNTLTFTGAPAVNFNLSASIQTIPNSNIQINLQNITTNSLPLADINGTFFITSSNATGPSIETIPEPYFEGNFARSLDCQPTLNNVLNDRKSTTYQDIDYSSGQVTPTNFELLINGNALKAEIQDSNYSSLRHILPRYEGSKNQSSDINFYDPNARQTDFGENINIGTYGSTPSINSLDTNIYEFQWGGGTTPEILGWGGLALGKILQVNSKDSVKTINPSDGLQDIIIPSRTVNSNSTTRNYRKVGNLFPPETIMTSSVGGSPEKFVWLTSQSISDYYQILNGNNPVNHEITLNMYPNPTAGSNPTIPSTTKILTAEYGVPSISNYGLTSSFSESLTVGGATITNSGFIRSGNGHIYLARNQHISRLTKDTNGYYNSATILKPSHGTIGREINESLNKGERWFVTLFNEFEFPNNQGDWDVALSSGSLSPYNVGFTDKDSRGNFRDPRSYKGVFEIIGTSDDNVNYLNIQTDREFTENKNIGGNGANNTQLPPWNSTPGLITGSSLGMLIWKAAAVGKNNFIIVQDEISGGVAEGAFTSRYTTEEITDNFEYITKTYGTNQTG